MGIFRGLVGFLGSGGLAWAVYVLFYTAMKLVLERGGICEYEYS